jgi:hypothetical protein
MLLDLNALAVEGFDTTTTTPNETDEEGPVTVEPWSQGAECNRTLAVTCAAFCRTNTCA